jgi:hypothetical protein
MSDFNAKNHDAALDLVISSILTDLNSMNADEEKYSAAADELVKLMKLKKEVNPSWMPSPDAILAAGATIITALLVLNYEKIGVVTSKAFAFVGKSMR